MKGEWKYLGSAGVDSGQLFICDPCYLSEWKDGEHDDTDNHYGQACQATMSHHQAGEVIVAGIAGQGVAFSSGFGDGNYPVYGKYKNYGTEEKPDIRIAEVKIKLID